MSLSRPTDQSLKPVPLSTDRSDFLTQINMITARISPGPDFYESGVCPINEFYFKENRQVTHNSIFADFALPHFESARRIDHAVAE